MFVNGPCATFSHTGGTHTITGDGFSSGQLVIMQGGTYTLSGGSLSAANAFVGGDDGVPAGAGVFTISGGTATFSSTLRIWNTNGTAVNLNSGTLSVGTIDTSGNPSRFHWTAGSLSWTGAPAFLIDSGGQLGSSLTLDASKADVTASPSL